MEIPSKSYFLRSKSRCPLVFISGLINAFCHLIGFSVEACRPSDRYRFCYPSIGLTTAENLTGAEDQLIFFVHLFEALLIFLSSNLMGKMNCRHNIFPSFWVSANIFTAFWSFSTLFPLKLPVWMI